MSLIALDAKTYKFCNRKIRIIFCSHIKDWLSFMRHQMRITRKILDLNYKILVSDIDAIWVKDPLKYSLL